MEAKTWQDTVMPLEYSALDGLHCEGISDEKILRALKAQAEISFKAGMEEESTQAYHAGLHDGILRGKKGKGGQVIEEVLHKTADPIKVKLIKGQKKSYGWEISVQGNERVDLLGEIMHIDRLLRGNYNKEEEK